MAHLLRRLPQTSRRSGALTVEFALTVPILFALVLGALEFSHVNMVRNTVENAAYEGARMGVVPGASVEDVTAETQTILDAIGVRDETITVSPALITYTTPEITVTVDVPMDSNGFIFPLFMKGKTLTKSVTLTREKLDSNISSNAQAAVGSAPGRSAPKRRDRGRRRSRGRRGRR